MNPSYVSDRRRGRQWSSNHLLGFSSTSSEPLHLASMVLVILTRIFGTLYVPTLLGSI